MVERKMQWACLLATVFVIMAAITIEGGERHTCPCAPNSTFATCGTLCERSCNVNGGQPRTCQNLCGRPKCYCNDGYVRNATGSCVLPQDCCNSATEYYTLCGSNCTGTCDRDAISHCFPGCIPGCHCLSPLSRRSDGKCVPFPECPRTKCDPNLGEEYSSCVQCPVWCTLPAPSCSKPCTEGCVCKPGTIRRKDGRCVIPEECFNFDCRANEVYSPCGTICPTTCASIRGDDEPPCQDKCQPGCVCVKNFVRDDFGECIPREFCDTCGPNEIYHDSTLSPCPAKTCDEYCYNKSPFIKKPPSCAAECRCIEGYLLDHKRCCVAKD